MATATMTLNAIKTQVEALERELVGLRAEADRHEKTLAAIELQKLRVPERELSELVRNREVTQALLDRVNAKISERQVIASDLWKQIRDTEAEERRQAERGEIEKLEAQTLTALTRLEKKFKDDPDLQLVAENFIKLRSSAVWNGEIPIPQRTQCAQQALTRAHDLRMKIYTETLRRILS